LVVDPTFAVVVARVPPNSIPGCIHLVVVVAVGVDVVIVN
jgi:hypothetical protein